MIVILMWLLAVNADTVNNETPSGKPKLVDAIRKRLMEDNYDYVATETEEDFPARRHNDVDDAQIRDELQRRHLDREIREHYDANYEENLKKDGVGNSPVNSVYTLRRKNKKLNNTIDLEHRRFLHVNGKEVNNFDEVTDAGNRRFLGASTEDTVDGNDHKDVDYIFSKNDLIQPADAKTNNTPLKEEVIDKNDEIPQNQMDEKLNSDMNFKLLKTQRASRRSMSSRRFLQGEDENGIVIVKLDDGPFPEFRLPRGRRQYMFDPGQDLVHSNETHRNDLVAYEGNTDKSTETKHAKQQN